MQLRGISWDERADEEMQLGGTEWDRRADEETQLGARAVHALPNAASFGLDDKLLSFVDALYFVRLSCSATPVSSSTGPTLISAVSTIVVVVFAINATGGIGHNATTTTVVDETRSTRLQ